MRCGLPCCSIDCYGAVWTATLQRDCHIAAWLPRCSVTARLHLRCPLVLRTFILQSLLRSPILDSSDAVLWLLLPKSRGLQGPITEPSSLFCSCFKNNWRSYWGHSFLRQGRLAGTAWALSVLSFSGCLEIVLMSQRSLNSGEPH